VIMLTGHIAKAIAPSRRPAGVHQILQMPIMDIALLDGIFSALGRAPEAAIRCRPSCPAIGFAPMARTA